MTSFSTGERSLFDPSEKPIQAAENLNATIYARTSSPQQQHKYSIGEQVRQCWNRCEYLDWTVVYVFQDEYESGKDTDRPQFQELLQRAEDGDFDVIVVWKLDRFSRSLMHAVKLERQLRDWEVGLHSITEQIDTTTAPGRFNFRNIASASELERDMIKARTQMGLRGMAAEKKWPNDNPPLGYKRNEEGTLEIVEEEAELVEFIFNRYIELKSMPEVADELNSKENKKRPKDWTPYAVGQILKKELYIGNYSLANVEKHVEEYQIITKDLFYRATEVRTRFQDDGKTERNEMPEERKERRINNVVDQYHQFLDTNIELD